MADTSDKTGNVKLGAAVLGGYVLGRTKKLKAGVRLAMWLAGDTGGPLPRVVGAARSGVTGLAGSDEVKALGEQVKGPLAEALQRAAMAALTSRLDRMTTGIQNRTEKLTSVVEGTTDTAKDTATKATSGVLGKVRGKGKDKQENESENPDQDDNVRLVYLGDQEQDQQSSEGDQGQDDNQQQDNQQQDNQDDNQNDNQENNEQQDNQEENREEHHEEHHEEHQDQENQEHANA